METDVSLHSLQPVILSGGAGTRLWPLSRLAAPKQLLPIATSQTMLQTTVRRVVGPQFKEPIIVGDEEHRFSIKDQLQNAGLSAASIILEPEGRNTAGAVAVAALWSQRHGNDDLLLILPSDHVIRDVDSFFSGIDQGIIAAQLGDLVTFGILPDSSKTGYGYIEIGEPRAHANGVARVKQFVEKPDAEKAADFVASGRFFWNSGIFLFRSSAILGELERFAPGVIGPAAEAMAGASIDGKFIRPEKSAFVRIDSIPLDYAVMEKTEKASVVPTDMGWSDVGSWDALWEISDKDNAGNVMQGTVIAHKTSNCLMRSETDAVLAAIGIERIAVVITRDAVLVSALDTAQDVKIIVDQLRLKGHESVLSPFEVFRPWGSFMTMDRGERFQTKRIIVKPGARLSLQKHHHRSEHWVVVKGTAEVTLDKTVRLLQENESTYIPAGMPHRLANPGRVPLQMIEVQCGPYLGEDDITRLDDEYGRS